MGVIECCLENLPRQRRSTKFGEIDNPNPESVAELVLHFRNDSPGYRCDFSYENPRIGVNHPILSRSASVPLIFVNINDEFLLVNYSSMFHRRAYLVWVTLPKVAPGISLFVRFHL
jgi:hypothetical protein